MESRGLVSLIFLLLLVLVFAGESHAGAQITDEDYWKAVWPNTAIPNPLQVLLKPSSFGADYLNINKSSAKFFFNNEIYPGKTVTIEDGGNAVWEWKMWKPPQEHGGKWTVTEDDLCVQKGSSIEDKTCAKSLKEVMNYVISKLGKNVKPLVSSYASNQNQYRVEGITTIGQKAVMCHELDFQKVSFYCHQVQGTTAYSVPLVAADGNKSQALAICHFNTAGMNMQSIREAMKVDPGTKPICHFFGTKGVLWVPNN